MGASLSASADVASAASTVEWRETNYNQSSGENKFSWGGTAQIGCQPIIGDWDGDGDETPGTACLTPNGWMWTQTNYNTSSGASTFGWGSSTWTNALPITGDWDGDGDTTVGLARNTPNGWMWTQTNYNTSSGASTFGWGGASLIDVTPITGDWDGDGDTTVGLSTAGRFTPTGSSDGGNLPGGGAFQFPLATSRSAIINHSPRWCYASQSNCHHDYNAADIFANTGTRVVSPVQGTVVSATTQSSGVGSRVVIQDTQGRTWYLAHMNHTNFVASNGMRVSPGTTIGYVGTSAHAVGTSPHLHIDVLSTAQYPTRPSCSGAGCTRFPFMNVQPLLIGAFANIPA